MSAPTTKPTARTLAVKLNSDDLDDLFGDNYSSDVTRNAFDDIEVQLKSLSVACEGTCFDAAEMAVALFRLAGRTRVAGHVVATYHDEQKRNLATDNLRAMLKGADATFDPEKCSASDLAMALTNLLPHAGYRPETAAYIQNALAIGFGELDRRSAARDAEIEARANGGAS